MNLKPSLKFLLIALSILLFGKLTEQNILFPRFNQSYAHRFQKVFSQKEKELNQILLQCTDSTRGYHHIHTSDLDLSKYIGLLESRGLAVFIYENDSLHFWSDNTIPIAHEYSKCGIDTSFIYLRNAWYVPMTKKLNNVVVVGLIQIKQVYQYENKFLVNEFQADFHFPATVKISSKVLPSGFPIVNSKQRFVFSLVFDSSAHHPLYQLYIPSWAYFIAILLLLWFFYMLIKAIPQRSIRNWAIVFLAIVLYVVKFKMLQFQFPKVFYELDLFRPFIFGTPGILPSLGDLLIWSILIFSIVFIFYKEFSFPLAVERKFKKWKIHVFLILHLTVILCLFSGIFFLVKSIILNSTISFEVNKLLLFDTYSVIGYIIIILLFASFTFYFDKVLMLFYKRISFLSFNITFLITCLVWSAIFYVVGNPIHLTSVIFIILLGIDLSYVRFKLASIYKYSTLIFIVFLFSVYTVFIVSEFSKLKNFNNKKVLITNLANEHDPVAEYILRDEINEQLANDTILSNYVIHREINNIEIHLKNRYFNSYFDKYNLQNITICNPKDSVELSDNSLQHCYTFFQSLIKEKQTLSKTNFYNIDNLNGRISYLGHFEFQSKKSKLPVSLYIELESKLISEELGYPELLLDGRFSYRSKLIDYSYAKYYKGNLISQYGAYSYNTSSKVFDNKYYEFKTLKLGDSDHMIYCPNRETLIVLSSPSVTFLDLLISFSYTFVVYFLVLTFIILIVNLSVFKNSFNPNFKNKIQYSMMSVLFLSLILIGGGTLYFNIKQYYSKHYEIISEKMQSIYIEMLHKMAQEKKIDNTWRSNTNENLNEVLINLSNIFYIDINMYNIDGNLMATSRPEVFGKGLIGNKINMKAYRALVTEMKSEIIHNEKIGHLNYISAYVPFKNSENKLLAFLNLPYFTRQEELTREVSAMIVTVANVYVLFLLLTFLIAVFISRKITLPLRIIQLKFSEIKLGQKYEKIEHVSNDEIGGLVNEYNRMVSELEKSVEMLAKSERESAWREMAKQIAHEINNPLTPMKLSVQHLQRAWIDKNERFEEYLDRISKTLIDEIDNLSAIATEFSNFAKMPNAINQQIDLIAKIQNVVNLFINNEVDFNINFFENSEVSIYADKEQISRVFINLFKNAIQSVDKNKIPSITINLQTDGTFVNIEIKDNGKGIPKEMQEKLFRPNFTTKSSGMGLGLAIVKNIIESCGGLISYETELNIGTTFKIKLPVYKDHV